jgi:quinoprotein dehydrogenase-associated probable ABC transporter substrate-binding protein
VTRNAVRCSLLVAGAAFAAMIASGSLAWSTAARAQGGPPAGAAHAATAPAQAPFELVDPKVFRVCGDPRNMPFSDTAGEGFENRLAELFAKALGKTVAYTWYPNAPGFVRRTLAIYKCDIIMGMPQGDDIVQVTNPYYRTAYTLVFKPGNGLDGVDTLTDERLKDKRIGIIAGTPPATNMVLDGLIAKAKPYPLVIDTRFDSSAAAMVKDIVNGEVDAGVLWGPLAGYYAKQSTTPLTVVPLLKEKNGPRMTYRIGMGVRYSDQNWKRELNRMIRAKQAEINALLIEYGVPILDDGDHLITAASTAK